MLFQASATLVAGLYCGLTEPTRMIWLPVLALFFTTYGWSRAQPSKTTRDTAKTLSLASGLCFGTLFAVLFWGVLVSQPEQFDVPNHLAPILGALLGAGTGLGALIVTLCALDSAGVTDHQPND